MGRAALEAGWDDRAASSAERAIELAPHRSAPREILAVAQYNLLLAGLPVVPDRAELERRHEQCVALKSYTDIMPYLAGVYAWLLGSSDEAVATWQGIVDENNKHQSQALAALLMADRLRPEDAERIRHIDDDGAGVILMLAKAARGDEQARSALSQHMTSQELDAQVRALQELFRQPAPH
jgi:hypothetical protein